MAKKNKSGGGGLALLVLVAVAGLMLGGWLILSQMNKDKETVQDTAHSFTMNVGDQRTLQTALKNSFSCTLSGQNIIDYNPDTKLITALASGEITLTALDSVTDESEVFLIKVVGDGVVTVPTTATTEVTTTSSQTTTSETTTLVSGAPTGIKLSYESATIEEGETLKYATVTMTPASTPQNLRGETWTSSNELIATVDKYGNITAVSAGDCVVTVTANSNPGLSARIEVKVTAKTTTTTTTTTTIPGQVITTTETTNTDVTGSNTSGTGSSTSTGANGAVTSVTTTTTAAVPAGERPDIVVKDGITYVQGIMIANKTYPLPANYNPGLQKVAQDAFNEMQAAAAKDGISLTICSGFRSYSTQKALYDKYVARDGKAAADRYSARPGHSEHQTGLAMDINKASSSFNGTKEAKWLAANCAKYGFIIRYPEGKESITGYMYESWHVRYLGKELAQKVTDSGLTLEEYLNITSVYAN
ncbi:MAG: D-alanyl-D-alanine carboxypeptidase family protein [Oscillospiraceae bacterium]|nr:D-alanyl-D-alanine carboxypeptidase family protein [Oscillospiraceae bacterium]